MSEENKKITNNKNTEKKKKKRSGWKTFFLVLLVAIIIGLGTVTGIVLSIAKDAPEIDPTNIESLLNQTSFILDENGELIEKIQTEEYRTIVEIDRIPEHLQNAFIAIEDERFETHIGVDPKGIISSLIDNIKAKSTVRGASTITQQLARNLYLSNEKKLDRKIKEAYLALKIEKALTKDQIMEAYLNRIYLGQNAYGVQEAAQTYFSKDVEDLTIAESALLAGVVKGPTKYSPFQITKPENFDENTMFEIGQVDILGDKYIAYYNETAVERQKLVLGKMLELNLITENEYNDAINEDIKTSLKPGEHKIAGISSYFTDHVKAQVIEDLMEQLGYTKEEAEEILFTGGLKIYSTMDIGMQHKLEEIYNNFTEILLGNPENLTGPIMINWRLDNNGNIIDEHNKIIYVKKDNIFDENYNLIVDNGTYEITDNGLIINNYKFTPYESNIDIKNYYTIDNRKNLVTYNMGSLSIPENSYKLNENKEIIISKDFLKKNEDFYTTDDNGNLLINEKYFFRNKDGVVQPQSATVIMDYRTGEIKSLVGGRDIEGSKMLNRATVAQRQPGSTIKPIAVYLPALDNGFTAASVIDDIPHYNHNGELWPTNWNKQYSGLNTLRRSVEQSINVNSVKTVEAVGIETSMEYLSRMGIINKDNPSKDNFVTREEDPKNNDENLSALGLGGMTKGLTPLDMTAAFGAIANDGKYLKPTSYTKVLDKDGNVLLENNPKETEVVSPEIAYIMTDILRTTVTNGLAKRAQIPNMDTAGKTGTTQEQADIWFVGYTPYYVCGVWIGNDSPSIRLSQGSGTAASLWQHIMSNVHENLEGRKFDRPANIVTLNVCSQSGKIPTDLCSHDPRGSTIISEIFAKGTEPTEFCETHVELKIDTSTNKIATEFCPSDSVASRVFITRDPAYNPKDHDGIVPSDYEYTAPTETCDIHNETTVDEKDEEEDEDEDKEKDRDEDIDDNEDDDEEENKDKNILPPKDEEEDKNNDDEEDEGSDNDTGTSGGKEENN